jgi:hypothetical protein
VEHTLLPVVPLVLRRGKVEDEFVKLRGRILDSRERSNTRRSGRRNRKVFRRAEPFTGSKFDISHAEGVGGAGEGIIIINHKNNIRLIWVGVNFFLGFFK